MWNDDISVARSQEWRDHSKDQKKKKHCHLLAVFVFGFVLDKEINYKSIYKWLLHIRYKTFLQNQATK